MAFRPGGEVAKPLVRSRFEAVVDPTRRPAASPSLDHDRRGVAAGAGAQHRSVGGLHMNDVGMEPEEVDVRDRHQPSRRGGCRPMGGDVEGRQRCHPDHGVAQIAVELTGVRSGPGGVAITTRVSGIMAASVATPADWQPLEMAMVAPASESNEFMAARRSLTGPIPSRPDEAQTYAGQPRRPEEDHGQRHRRDRGAHGCCAGSTARLVAGPAARPTGRAERPARRDSCQRRCRPAAHSRWRGARAQAGGAPVCGLQLGASTGGQPRARAVGAAAGRRAGVDP